jgi:hypothetical protein
MKGPYERLKYDLRRVWECPACAHKERTSGATATRLCACQEKLPAQQQRWMRLVEDGVRRVGQPPATQSISPTAMATMPAPVVDVTPDEQPNMPEAPRSAE